MVVEDFLSIYTTVMFLALAVPPLAFFVYALIHFSRSPRAAAMVIVGSALILLSSLGGSVLSAWMVKRMSVSEFGNYVPLIQLAEVAVSMVGVAIIVFAVFVDRNQVTQKVTTTARGSVASSNPYRAPVE